MSKVKELENAVMNLNESEFAHFRAWFEEYDARVWDRQFEQDVKTGKLDKIANEAIKDYKSGKYKKL